MLKLKDIEAIYTQKIMEYLTRGYIINATTMEGSCGDTHVDITNGAEVLRIALIRKYGSRDERILLIVGKAKNKPRGYFGDHIWNDNLEIIWEQKYTAVDIRMQYFVTTGSEEEKEIKEKRRSRAYNWTDDSKSVMVYTNYTAKRIAFKYLRKQSGCKSVKSKQIDSVRKIIDHQTGKAKWIINAKNKYYYL